ncbi:MAG: response regulator transcription factor [Bacillota bacterium]|nr:response regulator transcription factor [Bacillota bacterium]
MSQEKILIVEDEHELALLVKDYLEMEGFEVVIANNGQEGIEFFQKHHPVLVVLDIMLPKLDGMEVCRIIRNESAVPIIMLSAKKSDIDKILGLGLGADDYLTKPFSPGELVARVKAQIRRFTLLSSPVDKSSLLRFGQLVIDPKGYNTYLAGKKVELSAKEFEILSFLALHPQQVFTREQIFDRIWGFNEYGDINTVTVHIRKIREKLEENPSKPNFIKTVWGVGYKFDGGES